MQYVNARRTPRHFSKKSIRGFTPLEKNRSTFRPARRSSLTGFTLIETLVAISLLSVAIVAPMALTTKSLSAAYYARDQITAFHLGQEAIEALRSIRDGQILQIALNPTGIPIDIFGAIPLNEPFRIDARISDPATAIKSCSQDPGGVCKPIETDGTLYGYDSGGAPTHFTRTVHASLVGGGQDELRITVTVTWQTGAFKIRTFSISENLRRWLDDGAGT